MNYNRISFLDFFFHFDVLKPVLFNCFRANSFSVPFPWCLFAYYIMCRKGKKLSRSCFFYMVGWNSSSCIRQYSFYCFLTFFAWNYLKNSKNLYNSDIRREFENHRKSDYFYSHLSYEVNSFKFPCKTEYGKLNLTSRPSP
jgi:hypothetical protein